MLFLPPQQDFEKLRLTEEKLRTKTNEDSKTIEELADQLSKAKLEIDGLKALCSILPDLYFYPIRWQYTANLYSWTTSLLRLKSCRVQLVVVHGNLLHN